MYKNLSHDTGNSIKHYPMCRTIRLRTKTYRTIQNRPRFVSHDRFMYKNLSHDTEATPSADQLPARYETLTQPAGSVSGDSPTTVSLTVQLPSSATVISYVTVVSKGVVSQERANVKLTVAVPAPWMSKT